MIESRASKNDGRHGCSFIPFNTSLMFRKIFREPQHKQKCKKCSLHAQRIPMFGNPRFLLSCSGIFGRAIEVAVRHGSVGHRRGREEVVSESMFGDQSLVHNPKDLCPHLAYTMDAPITRLIECLVGRWVYRLVL